MLDSAAESCNTDLERNAIMHDVGYVDPRLNKIVAQNELNPPQAIREDQIFGRALLWVVGGVTAAALALVWINVG